MTMMNKMKDAVSKMLQPTSLFSHDEPTKRKRSTDESISTSTKFKYERSVIRSDVIVEEEYSHPTTTMFDEPTRQRKRFRSEDSNDIPQFDQIETKRHFDPTKSPLFTTPTKTNGDSTSASILYAKSLITKSSPVQTHRSTFVDKNYFCYAYPTRLSYIELLRQRRKKVEITNVVESPPIETIPEVQKKDFEIQCDIEPTTTEISIIVDDPIEIVPLQTNVTPFSWPKFVRAQAEFAAKCRFVDSIWKCSFCTKENPFDVSLCSLCFAPNPNVEKKTNLRLIKNA